MSDTTPAKGSPEEMQSAHAWLEEVADLLGLDRQESRSYVGDVLKLTSAVAHNRSRPAAPVTAFLIGLAAGRSGLDPSQILGDVTARAGDTGAAGRTEK